MKRIAVLGTVGVPANYGGFETLVENLVNYHQSKNLPDGLTVYCSAKSYLERPKTWKGAELRYIKLNANGASSIPYDIVSLFSAVRHRADVIILLGVSGAVALPLIRLISSARVLTNIDGIEWKRDKWGAAARWFLRLSEKLAVRFSHEVIADNGGIAEHVRAHYGADCHVIAYGGDHAVKTAPKPYTDTQLPGTYALALCRIEPENNVAMILEAFANKPAMPLVFVGNWASSAFGQSLRDKYRNTKNLYLLDPVYDAGVLYTIRSGASLYVHGHSAGGTNPSLVEMMHFGLPVAAFDCVFNRYTTEDRALFFFNAAELAEIVQKITPAQKTAIGEAMSAIAAERYTWEVIGAQYFQLADENR